METEIKSDLVSQREQVYEIFLTISFEMCDFIGFFDANLASQIPHLNGFFPS